MSMLIFTPPGDQIGQPFQASQKITLIEANALTGRYQAGNMPFVYFDAHGNPIKINSFHFDVDDIRTVIANLLNTDQIFISLGQRPDGSHTLILGGCRPVYNGEALTNRNIIYDYDNHPIYDYCDPCPPACPR